MDDKRYRIEEQLTSGWELVNPEYTNLTKDRTTELLQFLYSNGTSPERIRVVREK